MPDGHFTVEYRDLSPLGFPGYRIGNDGSLWTCWEKIMLGWRYGHKFVIGEAWRRMKPKKLHSGRLLATLKPNMQYRQIHRLVLEAFVGPCPDGLECCHEDDDPTNNNLSNLRWDTHLANMADRALHGKTARGEKAGGAKLCEQTVQAVRNDHGSYAQLAKKYGVSAAQISRIINRRCWCHVS